MELKNAFAIFFDLYAAIKLALIPTIRDVWYNPRLIFDLGRVFMTHVWAGFADGTNDNGRAVKEDLITPHAKGVVLDIGAGYGHTVDFLDREKVTTYIALEPNVDMHPLLRQRATAAGYLESDGSLVVLSCYAQDTEKMLQTLNRGPQPVDTIVSVLTICTVPEPQKTLKTLVRDMLKPGGNFLYYEHVLSPRKDVAWWQRFWAPLWCVFFDGCRLDRPIYLWVEELKDANVYGEEISMWKEGSSFGKPGEPEENLWWHQAGRFVRA